MRKLAARCLVLIGSLIVASPVWASVIDFEDVAPLTFGNPLVSRGFEFAANGSVVTIFNGGFCNANCAANGTTTLAAGGLGLNPPTQQPVVMKTVSGNDFYFNGIDYAEFVGDSALYNKNVLNASVITLVGHLAGGGLVVQALILDGVNDGPGGLNDFQSALLSPAWNGARLSSLDIQGFNGIGPTTPRGFQIDNVGVSEIPEPGTLMLIGSGLAGLAMRRRRA